MAEIAFQKQPLGVGAIISDTFSILFSNFLRLMVLGLIGMFGSAIVFGIFFAIIVGMVGVGIEDLANGPTLSTFSFVFIAITIAGGAMAYLFPFVFIAALVSSFSYDVKLGRRNPIWSYVKLALPAVIPITLSFIGLVIVFFVGMFITLIVVAFVPLIGPLLFFVVFLTAPLWAYATVYVMVPACVVEKSGLRCVGRSFKLTRDYRWPIVGLSLLLSIVSFVVLFALGILSELLGPVIGLQNTTLGDIITIALAIVVFVFAASFGAISVALTYARLREIKEGVDVDQIAAVFD